MTDFGVGEWFDFMPDTVHIDAFVSRTVSGAPVFAGAPVGYPARIEIKNHLTLDKSGRLVTARGRVFMGTAVVPNIEDQVTLPGRFVPINPPIIAVNAQSDELGTHHVTLEIG